MRKSEIVGAQFSSVLKFLELADGELQSIRELEAEPMQDLVEKLLNLIDEVEEAMYETCAPLEMAEDERDQEIAKLERRLAELKTLR